jgi:hypothetical protein
MSKTYPNLKKKNKNNTTMDKHEEDENLHKADQVYFLYDPQPVRLLDVIYVGPVMIYAGVKAKNINAFVKWSLIGVGICTILYNGANFYINERKAFERKKLAKEEAERKRLEELKRQIEEAERMMEAKMEANNNNFIKEEVIQAVEQEELYEGERVEIGEVDTTLHTIDLPQEVKELIEKPFDITNNGNAIVKRSKGRPKKAPVYRENGKEHN